MRVLQLIDSLRPGGAEKMAVSYANSLVGEIETSYLCCTRSEGLLNNTLDPEVEYLFLGKKNSLDFKAFDRLRKFIKQEGINIVHAHSSSFFLAGLVKISGLDCKVVWHVHNGASKNLMLIETKIQSFFSAFFQGIITVNSSLKKWAEEEMNCSKVIEIKNFVPEEPLARYDKPLGGETCAFKIICVANLRPQKDHINLLEAFELLDHRQPFSLHLIGENPGDEYSKKVFKHIEESPVKNKIFYYGVQLCVLDLLRKANLAILASRYEGLPVALLEYGIAGLPIVATNLEQYKKVIGENGIVVPPANQKALSKAISFYYRNQPKMLSDAIDFQKKIRNNYSANSVLPIIINFYKNL